MHNRRRLSLLITASLLLALGVTLRVCAQSAPRPLPLNLIGATDLNEAQIAELNGWVRHWADALNTASAPAEVERARAQLIMPLNQPDPARMISPSFRRFYSQAATPEMEKALAGGDLHRSVNALLVLSQLGDGLAADAILRQINPQTQPRWQIRNAAASAARVLLQGGTLDARKLGMTIKALRDAATREDNGLVLTHLLLAINAADAEPVAEADRASARTLLVEAMASIADRLAARNDLSVPMLHSFATALEKLRPRLLTFPAAQRDQIAKVLGPALLKILQHVQSHWEPGRAADPKTQEDLAKIAGAAEASLQTVDSIMRRGEAPKTEIKNAWVAGDKAKFDAGITAWQDVLSKPPY